MDSVIFIKILSALIYPMGLFVLMLLFSRLFSIFKKVFLSRFCSLLAIIIFILSSNPVFASWLIRNLEKQYPQPVMQDIVEHDAIIVLGGGLRRPVSPAKHAQLSSTGDRYWYAAQLYRAGKGQSIVISAGNIMSSAGLQSEAYYARDLLVQWGVPYANIFIDEKSRTTSENRQMVQTVIANQQIKTALLVTSAMHMPRSHQVFKTLPISVTPAPTDILIRNTNRINGLRWIPSAGAMQLSTLALHEYYGMFYNDLKALIDSGV